MTGEIIKSFLVGLGFGVDDASLAKFNKAINSATLKVAALYTSIQVAAAGIFKGISSIASNFEDLGYSLRLVAPAVNKMLILRQAMLTAYSRAGIDLVKVVKQSILFNYSLAKTKFALDAIYKSVGAKFLPLLTKQMDIFRAKIFANMPKIQAILTKFVNVVFKAFGWTVQLGERLWTILGHVWEFFVKLDEATGGWSTKLLGFIALWKLLNLEFLATPLGMILAGLLSILLLWDDFKTWQEGGKSLFDWSYAIPIFNAIKNAAQAVLNTLSNLVAIVFDVILAFQQLFKGDFSGAFDSLKRAGMDILGVFTNLWGVIKNIGGGIGIIGTLIGDKLAGIFGGTSANQALIGPTQPQPLVAPQAGGVNQKVSQQTNINVQGSADAHAVGRAVAGQQNNVNFDMTRNLKGAMQ